MMIKVILVLVQSGMMPGIIRLQENAFILAVNRGSVSGDSVLREKRSVDQPLVAIKFN